MNACLLLLVDSPLWVWAKTGACECPIEFYPNHPNQLFLSPCLVLSRQDVGSQPRPFLSVCVLGISKERGLHRVVFYTQQYARQSILEKPAVQTT